MGVGAAVLTLFDMCGSNLYPNVTELVTQVFSIISIRYVALKRRVSKN